jgi:hypothetical protein
MVAFLLEGRGSGGGGFVYRCKYLGDIVGPYVVRAESWRKKQHNLANLTRKQMGSARLRSCRSTRPWTVLVTIAAPYAIEYEFTRRIRGTSWINNIRL